ncbi:MAG: hypothetical protein HY362_02860 [Candidatus Aenigmarchaeota archaeon]|nr:hypothetical protein [Candidatus Aenigmarchaeota archaeon]
MGKIPLLAFAVITVLFLALGLYNVSVNTGLAPAKTGEVSTTSTYSLVSGFVYEKPIVWDRTVIAKNPGLFAKTTKLNFGKGAEVISAPANAKIHGKETVSFDAPPGDSSWVFRFQTSPIYVTESILNSEQTNYKKHVTVKSDYHYKNIPINTDLPGLPPEYHYSVVLDSNKKNIRKALLDKNNVGKKDGVRWTIPSLSADGGDVSAQKDASRISNYDLETVRAGNSSLPENWTLMQDINGAADEINWEYNPLESGYQSATALRIKYLGAPQRVFSDKLEATGTGLFNVSFNYLPNFTNGATCNWAFGVEVLFANGDSDTSLPFEIDSAGNIISTPGEYKTSTIDVGGGWYNITANSNTIIDKGKLMRFYTATDSCNQFPGSSFLIDNVIFQS